MKHITHTVLVLSLSIFSILSLSGFKQPMTNEEWTVSSSSVKFKIKNAGFNVDGSFGEFRAKLIFNTVNMTGNYIEATVSAKTVNTGNNTRDGHLRKDTYFDVAKYPLISLKSTSFSKLTNGTYNGRFKLTIKNVTKDITIPFTFSDKGNTATIKGSFTINRLNYTVGESSMVLSDNATISIEVNVSKKV